MSNKLPVVYPYLLTLTLQAVHITVRYQKNSTDIGTSFVSLIALNLISMDLFHKYLPPITIKLGCVMEPLPFCSSCTGVYVHTPKWYT